MVGGAGAAACFLLLGGSSTPPLTLKPTAASPRAGASPGSAASSGTTASGRWTVAAGSVAGYRVREKLAFLPAPSDAVGRTSSITGDVTASQSGDTVTVTAASFAVDVSTLTSDKPMRDNRIHGMGLESDQYPRATFELTQPVTVPNASSGHASTSITGRLTIHGVTKTVTIPVQAQLNGSEPEVAGSYTFPFSDFDMDPPSIGGFVSVEDHATMEFDLHLKRA